MAGAFDSRPALLIYLVGTLASLLASVVMVAADPLVNADGVLYLRMARGYLHGGYEAAAAVYPRAFYPVLIGLTHQASGLPVLAAAHVVNALFCAMLVCGFVALVREMGAGTRASWLALLVIMLLPQLNEYRHYVVRDFGYWAFALWSVVAFCRWRGSWGVSTLLCWFALVAVAALFRPEAVALYSMPLCLLIGSGGRFVGLAPMRALAIAGTSAVLIMLGLVLAAPDLVTGIIGEPLRSIAFHARGVFELPDRIPDTFGAQPFGPDPAAVPFPGMLLVVVYIVVAHALEALGWPALLGLAGTWAAARRRLFPWRNLKCVFWVAGLQGIILLVVAADRLLLQSRHCMIMVLMLIALLPFLLDRLLGEAARRRIGWLHAGLGLIVAYLAVDSFVSFGSSKSYVLDAARWVRNNTPAESVLYTNSVQIAWHSHRDVDWEAVASLQRNGPFPRHARFDYLALVVKHDDAGILAGAQDAYPDLVIHETVADSGRGRVVILRRARPPPGSP